MCQILSSGLFSVINILLECNTGFRVKDWDSDEIKSEMSTTLCPEFTKRNTLSFYLFTFCSFFFFTMRHFPSVFHASFFPRSVRCQEMQAGHVPHHKACSGLDESLNYLMATVGAFRRCHLLSRGETGWLTGWRAYSRGTNQSHSRCSFNKITGGILCDMTPLKSLQTLLW